MESVEEQQVPWGAGAARSISGSCRQGHLEPAQGATTIGPSVIVTNSKN